MNHSRESFVLVYLCSMIRVTVAHQGTTTSNTEYDIMSMNQDHLSQLLANQTDYVPVEDLTGEVEELMMR